MKNTKITNTFKPPKRNQLIGRDEEIKTLKKIAEEQNPAMIIMYGRRRVGKTS